MKHVNNAAPQWVPEWLRRTVSIGVLLALLIGLVGCGGGHGDGYYDDYYYDDYYYDDVYYDDYWYKYDDWGDQRPEGWSGDSL